MGIEFEAFGDRLRLLRMHARLTQKELAERLRSIGVKVDNSYISRMETQNHIPGSDVLIAMARALGTRTDYLLGLDDREFYEEEAPEVVRHLTPEADAIARMVDALPQAIRRRALVYVADLSAQDQQSRRTEQMEYIAQLLDSIRAKFGDGFVDEVGRLIEPPSQIED